MKNLAISKITLREETPLVQVIDSLVLPLPRLIYTPMKGAVSGIILGELKLIFSLIIIRVFNI
jgi:hypothetical protein